jgi:hypothetical protein
VTNASLPNSAEFDALAAQARRLAAEIENAQARLSETGSKAHVRAGWRLNDAAGLVRLAADEVATAAAELVFIESVRSRPHCGAEWGCCPDHGATLSSSSGRSWCTVPGCRLEWSGDRMGLPWAKPPVFRLEDAGGTVGLVCAGHAIAAREQIAGARLLPIEGDDLVAGEEGRS